VGKTRHTRIRLHRALGQTHGFIHIALVVFGVEPREIIRREHCVLVFRQRLAIDNYRKALAKDENAVFAANNLAWLYAEYNKGNMDEAVRLAQGAVQANPGVPSFSDTLGWVYYKKGLYGAAAEQLKKAVSIDEDAARRNNGMPTPSYRFHLAVALDAKGDKSGARKELETALRLGEKANFPEADEAKKRLASL